ncbi:MAG: hypothetical protein JWM80_3795 [Cyanobacteria bacterium RYN_339]|nr:hypothetical protein [Cyanobacteria bacterium RYN_339]
MNFKHILAVAAILTAAGCAAPVQHLATGTSDPLVQAMHDGPAAGYGKVTK